MPAPIVAVLALSALVATAATAAEAQRARPALISVLIDDMGYRLGDGLAAIALPGPLGYSILPHTPHAKRLLEAAREAGREVLVHLPMEAVQGNGLLGPGALRADMNHEIFVDTVHQGLDSLPAAVGVNNHMGSLLTRHTLPMGWLMQSLKSRGLFFIDSRTTAHSVAARVAREHAVPVLSRDVFLDNEREADHVRAQFHALVAIARRRGHALGIGHPHPVTVAVLASELAALDPLEVRLVSPGELLRMRAVPPARTLPAPPAIPLRH